MRRFAIFAAALLLLLPGRSAQSQVKLALTGGANLSTLDNYAPSWSWHGRAFGVTFGFPVSDNWSIQLAGARSGKGFYEEYDTEGCNPYWCSAASGLLLTYLEFMVLSDRRIELGDRVRLHLLAGPFFGVSTRTRMRHTRSDFGVAAGALIEVGLHGNWGLQAGTVYTHGLVNTQVYKYPYQAHSKTRTLTLRGGLSYSIR